MAQVRHAFVSAKSDDPDTTLVRPSNWNADHEGLVFVRKTVRTTINTDDSLNDDPHLILPLLASAIFAFEAYLAYARNSATAGS